MDQPEWKELTTVAAAQEFASKVGYPVLVRPSFVLSGAAMAVASSQAELMRCLQEALDVSPDNRRAAAFYRKQGFVFLPEWEPLESHPHIQVQKMEWVRS